MDRRSPYQGLVPFREADADYFFGRDTWIEVIADNLLAYPLSLLYGGSGIGKTSLVRAGVAHRWDALAPTASLIVFDAWLGDPVPALEHALQAAAERRGALSPSTASLHLGDAPIHAILDQFEDFFFYHGRGPDSERSVDALAELLRDPPVPANFLLSFREDTLAALDVFDGRIPDLFDNLLRLDHLTRAAAREAIERPLARWNRDAGESITIEPELVEAVLAQTAPGRVREQAAGRGVLDADADRETDAIEAPYLQLVMQRLFEAEQRRSSVMRLETLDRLGGAERIVRTHLDDTVASLSPRDRAIAASLFEYLVTPAGTKIALPAAALAQWTHRDEKHVDEVLHRLASGEQRILRSVVAQQDGTSTTSFEIFHDRLAPAIVSYRERQQRRRRRRVVGFLGAIAAILAVVAASALVALNNRQAKLEEFEVSADIGAIRNITPNVTFADFLRVTGKSRSGYDASTLATRGVAMAVPIQINGYRGSRMLLRSSVLAAVSGSLLSGPSIAAAIAVPAVSYLVTTTTWSPYPQRRQRFVVALALEDEDGSVLARAQTTTQRRPPPPTPTAAAKPSPSATATRTPGPPSRTPTPSPPSRTPNPTETVAPTATAEPTEGPTALPTAPPDIITPTPRPTTVDLG